MSDFYFSRILCDAVGWLHPMKTNLRPPDVRFDTWRVPTMAGIRLSNTHYWWEDIVSMTLGALIALTPSMSDDVGNQMATANALMVGLVVMALGAAEFLDLRRWEEGLETACGLWLIASPFIFGYADTGTLRFWHFVLGAAVVLLAMLELRQDWKLSDAEI